MKYFNLFSNILVTRGIKRVLLSDLQRNKSELFPIELGEIINDLSEKSIEDVVKSYDAESQDFVIEYIDILLKYEFGFITKDNWDKSFPPITYEYFTPSKVTNAFLEIDDLSDILKINESLANLGTMHIVLYYSKPLTLEDFMIIEDAFKKSTVTAIEIFSRYYEKINHDFLNTLNKFCTRIYSLVFYNCDNIAYKPKDIYKFSTSFTKDYLKINSCGKVDLKYFNTNISKVSEAINHNSCLYKKIGIDKKGNIKTCPAMEQCFGNINEVSLEEAIENTDFKKYWNLTKDSIEICKDCEFRYICTDCRAYTEQTNYTNEGLDISKPLKCGYDPHTGKWEKWSKNPLKQTAIKFYNLK
ncbi:grasp-with-spasm system SPASM domain peptide maturase [uncultured Chryseobacterium sp.]|uniref:grasp-with-spasm system SPASM domain peptide maturase n=1 Tax=uncultured Chryseobacterium sp. TaxID=259322 RepID=UPI0025F8F6DD|nr:grasp-with-spasm system SPASM domain peptide maturase [uncultured Chryseobacterium sp.]